MKMRHLYLSFSIIAMASTFAMAATITPATPKQDADDCYMISSPEELYGFAAMVNGDGDKEPKQDICGKLTKDITINTNVLKTAAGKSNVSENGMYTGDTSKLISWVPMGSSEKPFLGSFRGQGNTISGLYFNDDTVSCVGLFKYAGNEDRPVIIDSLGIEDAYLRGESNIVGFVYYVTGSLTLSEDHFSGVVASDDYSGSLVGFGLKDGGIIKVSKSYGTGTMFSKGKAAGLVLGGYSSLEMEDSYFIGDIKGGDNVGGLIGHADGQKTTVTKSYFKGSIDASSNFVGGLFGYASSATTIITDSYAEANIKAGQEAGGLVGEIVDTTIFRNCYFKGSLDVDGDFAGGIVGRDNEADSTLIIDCHAEIDSFYTKEFGGGLVGQVHYGYMEITNSYAKGDINGESYLGGLAAQTTKTTIIAGSYYEGDVKAASASAFGTGGLVGLFYGALSIKESYSFGNVEGKKCVGGLIGQDHDSSEVVNSYFVGNVYGEESVGGFIGCIGKAEVLNSYALGTVTANSGSAGAFFGEIPTDGITSDNLFYLEDKKSAKIDKDMEGTYAVPSEDFASGDLAFTLREFESSDGKIKGDVWGQDFSGETPDEFPVLISGIIYPIKAELNGGSVKGGMAEGYEYGTKFTFPTPTREHYVFKGWYTDASFAEGTEITEIPATNKGLVEAYAKWQALRYKIEVDVNDSTMGILVGAGTYDYGYELTLKAVAKTGYQFSNWTDDAKAPAERKVVVTGATTYTANFEVIPPSSSEEAAPDTSAEEDVTKNSSSSSAKATSSSSAKVNSSSSKNVIASSSSAKQSSSSSSAKAKSSSSSSKKGGKSSSSGKDAIVVSAQLPQFSVTVANRLVQVDGIVVGTRVALLDMQGRVLAENVASAFGVSMVAPRAGACLLRVGSVTRTVHVK